LAETVELERTVLGPVEEAVTAVSAVSAGAGVVVAADRRSAFSAQVALHRH
jgi:hypothetical protein